MPRLLITPDLFPRLTCDCRVSESPGGVPLSVVLPPIMGDRGMAVVVASERKGWLTIREHQAVYAADQRTEAILLEEAPAFVLAECVPPAEEGEPLSLRILDGDRRGVLVPGHLYMVKVTRAPLGLPPGDPIALLDGVHGSKADSGEDEIRRAA